MEDNTSLEPEYEVDGLEDDEVIFEGTQENVKNIITTITRVGNLIFEKYLTSEDEDIEPLYYIFSGILDEKKEGTLDLTQQSKEDTLRNLVEQCKGDMQVITKQFENITTVEGAGIHMVIDTTPVISFCKTAASAISLSTDLTGIQGRDMLVNAVESIYNAINKSLEWLINVIMFFENNVDSIAGYNIYKDQGTPETQSFAYSYPTIRDSLMDNSEDSIQEMIRNTQTFGISNMEYNGITDVRVDNGEFDTVQFNSEE